MDYNKALSTIENQEILDAIQGYVASIKSKDIVALGTDEAFALCDKTGDIKAFKQNVHLSAANKGLVQPVYNGPWVISAQGYEMWAKEAGASVIFLPNVVVGNDLKPNPYVEKDPKNNRVLAVYARAVAFQYSSKGIPMIVDWTTNFDVPSYRMIDLLAKAKKFPQAFKLLPAESKPAGGQAPSLKANGPEVESTWASYPFDESTNLWVNTAHEEVLQWYSQIINREKKAIDFAQTFARRNALKHLSTLQQSPGVEWNITVLCWRPTTGGIVKWDAAQYKQLRNRVASMVDGNGDEFQQQLAQITTGSERVSDEEGYDATEKETDPEDQVNVSGPKEKEEVIDVKPLPELSDEDQKIMNNYEVTKENFPDEWESVIPKYNNIAFTPSIAQEIVKKIEQIIDGK